jgi:hypothetical protein
VNHFSTNPGAGSRFLWMSMLSAALFVGVTPGCSQKSPRGAVGAVGAARIKVGPGADDVDPETQTLSKADHEVVFWIAVDKNGKVDESKNLLIEFEDPDVFDNTPQQPNKHYRVQCKGWFCYSGEISSKAMYDKKYLYYQILSDANDPHAPVDKADGHIIITKP